jgi:hypothetical protein
MPDTGNFITNKGIPLTTFRDILFFTSASVDIVPESRQEQF